MAHGAAIWLPFVQPFGTVLIGIGAGLIAYRQWRTANNKVRLDIFESRSQAYERVCEIFDRFCNEDRLDQRDVHNLFALNRGAPLLFGKRYVDSLGRCIEIVEARFADHKSSTKEDGAKYHNSLRTEQKILYAAFFAYASIAHIR